MYIIIIVGLASFILASIATWYVVKNKYEVIFNAIQNEANIKLASLQNQINLQKESNQRLFDQSNLNNNNLLASQKEQYSKLENVLSNKDDENKKLQDIINKDKAYISQITTKLGEQKLFMDEKLEMLNNSEEKLKIQFENLAGKIFAENKKQSNDNINMLLKPFKDQLSSFNTRVNDIYTEETKQRVSLSNEIKYLKELNIKISNDATNLTKALKGENKTQGDWGEMILSKILEQTGLKEGKEYSVQGSYVSNDGKRLRPDIIVHLPEKKDIIIDSKVSLNGYLKYVNAQDNNEKEIGTKELLKSLSSHIKDLSKKKYEDLKDVNSLDFVLMFIPIEGAFMLASNTNNDLFNEAFKNNIMLVSPSTLFVTLRTIENIWRNEDQNQNAKIIAKKAADMYDKFEGFVIDMEDLGKSIKKSKDSYDSAFSKLSHGNGNLMKRSEEFKKLGVNPKKSLKIKDEVQ